MTLKEWREEAGLSRAEAGERFRCSAEAVRRYEAGERIPDRETMPVIVEVTAGRVTPNDFFGIEKLSAEQAAA